MEGMDLGLKRPATLPLEIVKFIVMVIKVATMIEVDIGLEIPATLPISIV